MSFQTIPFLIFLCVVIGITAITKNEKIRQYELLIVSIIFYGSWDYRFLFLIILCIAIVHIAGQCILNQHIELHVKGQLSKKMLDNSKMGGYLDKRRKIVLAASITALLLILAIFKYLKFFMVEFCNLLGIENSPALSMILPVGISFYIFSCIGYVVDMYRGDINVQPPLYQEALYVIFFPKVLQGPFLKASDFYTQLKQEHPVTMANLSYGIQVFLFGLIKKIVIADRLGLFVDNVYEKPAAYSGAALLLAAVTYPVQLYCDFSGYSDMAVGTAKILGYDLPKNFNLPFLSKNVTEYWRRWHMSLNSWFREYLFYTIVRSRWVNNLRRVMKGKDKKLAKIIPPIIGMAVVWPLVGLWHGASLNFVLYGCLYGILMLIDLIGHTYWGIRNEKFDFLRIIRTWFVTIFAMIMFRAADLETVGVILKGIFTWQMGISYIYTWSLIFIPIVVIVSFYAYKKNHGEGLYIQLDLSFLRNKVVFCTAVLLTIILMYVGENYFMYFQF